uniref:Uncharacterized protein n=1 Tax=Globodera rostochiensis TaxID=31243 RepID=A0A914H996_GLORO
MECAIQNSILELHSDWMLHGDKPTTSGGNLRTPPMEIYLEWIVSAWETLSKDITVKRMERFQMDYASADKKMI